MASSAPSRPAELTELLDPVVGGAGFVLEKVTVTPAGRRRVVRVVVDLPEDAVGAMSLDQAADVTRAVSTALDDAGAFGEQPYLLEVGSPGVDRPLTEPRHWRRSRTRLVQVDVTGEDGTARRVTGRVVEAGAAGVVLVVDEKGAAERLEVPWDRLGTGAVQVEFDRKDAPADEDDEDLDDEPDDDEHDDAHDEDEDEG
ncbi:ribosome maturation factor RimP [Pseudokineococcus lusitanus]|uniref:Ribosome maturation factor RimP n=1 Tax=Pseudokineococcus lusitanus TaxID=763993 RepID=A0A3N1HMC2_9ACTN|nr:ribosome maturation factor RimP [Pseudokineococcus lusitanus]ROP43683.1 ribosome maturation factor RimP [Pseudokineococcus lusitanus]